MYVNFFRYGGDINDADMSQEHFTIKAPPSASDNLHKSGDNDFKLLAQVAALCNRAEFKPDQVKICEKIHVVGIGPLVFETNLISSKKFPY